jgi:polygalacturonase
MKSILQTYIETHLYMKRTWIYAAVCSLLLLPAGTLCYGQTAGQTYTNEFYQSLPFKMQPVARPSFKAYEVNIRDFGAQPGGIFLNTEAINKAIRAVNKKGGGRVIIPAGLWLTGPIKLLSNVELHTEANALVYFSEDHTLFPIVKANYEGVETRRCTSPITAENATNIAITGAGVFDGNGDTWRPVKKNKLTEGQWKKLVASGGLTNADKTTWYPSESSYKGHNQASGKAAASDLKVDDKEWESIRDFLRPVLLNFVGCKKVLLEGVTFKNSPSWCLHPELCEDITIQGVTVSNPWYSQNGDALDLESCSRALITDCSFDAGDDAICIKSGKDKEGRERGKACEYVVVKDNTVLHGHGGFVVGSEMSGGVHDIYVDNCTFMGTDVGLRFKSRRGRGGLVENIFISNINMTNIPAEAILFDLFYGGQSPTEVTADDTKDKAPVIPVVTEETPAFQNIHIQNIACKGAGKAVFFNGLPEMPIRNIQLENVLVTEAEQGAVLNNAEGVVIKDLTIRTKSAQPTVTLTQVKGLELNGLHYEEVGSKPLKLNF